MTDSGWSRPSRLLAALLFILTLPVLSLTALIILLHMRESPVFTQLRLGLRARPFRMYKLKTFKNGSTTRLSRIIRRLALDEIPQLLNIIRGEMAFVGPRPELLTKPGSLGHPRFKVKPGMTGLWQVFHRTGENEIDWFYDELYVRWKNPRLNAWIVLWTVPSLLGIRPTKPPRWAYPST